jgi:hypothetical protein|tara:strand:+ start:3242 stop:4102 length:861 start_codon:yes stop_codon:yes gene_type:complete
MDNGIVIFAHNNRQMDYAKMAVVAGGLAKKHLGYPVSLVTDDSTVDYMKTSETYKNANNVFDSIILVDRPPQLQQRTFHDGKEFEVAPFNNSNRPNVWDITPYERTLMIDCDYLVFSDTLNNYWNVDQDILISHKYNDIIGQSRTGYHDTYVSDTGVKLLWATTVMFTKNDQTKIFFRLVQYIKDNYKFFADTYRFDSRMYRNDISFAIANHILNGFQDQEEYTLPPVFSTVDKDILVDVKNSTLQFLSSPTLGENYLAVSSKGNDIHIMNKKSLERNVDKLMELI